MRVLGQGDAGQIQEPARRPRSRVARARRCPRRSGRSGAPRGAAPTSAFLKMSKPSAYACISPYSMPLWTIFTKCPEPDGPAVEIALLGGALAISARRRGDVAPARGQCAEHRLDPLHRLLRAAHHQAVAALDAPHAAAGPGVDVVDALLARPPSTRRTSSLKKLLPPSMIVSPGLEQRRQRLDGVLGGPAGRDHHPHRARLLQLGDQLLEALRRGGAFLGEGPPPRRRLGRRPRRCGRPSSAGGPCFRPSGPGRSFRSASLSLPTSDYPVRNCSHACLRPPGRWPRAASAARHRAVRAGAPAAPVASAPRAPRSHPAPAPPSPPRTCSSARAPGAAPDRRR